MTVRCRPPMGEASFPASSVHDRRVHWMNINVEAGSLDATGDIDPRELFISALTRPVTIP